MGLGPDNAFLAWSVAAIALLTFFGSLTTTRPSIDLAAGTNVW
jgi:hypothetical protein